MICDSDFCFNRSTLEHRKRVRAVYSTPEGQQELFNILNDLGSLKAISAEQLDRRNYAVFKLEEIGLLDEVVVKRLIKEFFASHPDDDEADRLKRKLNNGDR